MTKALTRWLVFGSALITLAAGCLSFANRTPSSLASSSDVATFALFSPVMLLPFWLSLMAAADNKLANRILVVGAFLISILGAWIYYYELIANGKAEAVFAFLIVPAFQFFLFICLWVIIYVANRKCVN